MKLTSRKFAAKRGGTKQHSLYRTLCINSYLSDGTEFDLDFDADGRSYTFSVSREELNTLMNRFRVVLDDTKKRTRK